MASGSSAVRDPLRVAVVGGGVAGLSAAYFVEKYATEAGLRVDTHLLEAQERVGGHIVSEHKDGFLIEGGPDCFLSRKPGGMELVRELGLEGDLVGTESRNARTFVLSGGMLHPLPEGTMLMIPTKVLPVASSRLLSWKGKLRMGLDLVLPRGGQGGDESLGAFVRRRLGEEALRKIAEPLVAGVHAGDPDVLSLASTFSRFREMEDKDRSLILAMLRARRRAGQAREVGDKGAPSAFVALRGGMDGLTRGLRDGLSDGVVNTGRKVTVVTPAADTSGGYVLDVESSDGIDRLEVDQVILALPASQAAQMIQGFDRALAHELGAISFNSAATVTLGYPVDRVGVKLNGHGFVVPRGEKCSVMGVTWSSSKFKGRAPEGCVAVRAFIGGVRDLEVDSRPDEEIVDRASRDVGRILRIKGEPILKHIYRWPAAMPQYELGHAHRMERVHARLASWRGLSLAGSSYNGIGISDCVSDGRRAARLLVFGET